MNNHKERAHAVLSASSSGRWLKCPPSAVAATLYPETETDYTREGTLAHEVAEHVARGGDANLEELRDWEKGYTAEMLDCAMRYSDYIKQQIKGPDAVVLLEQRLDFSHWVPDGFGTGDCIIIQGGHLDVIDYKYGQGVEVSAVENSQMRLYGLGALHDFGDIYDIKSATLHIFQPRKDNVSTEDISSEALLAWGEAVRPVAALAAEGAGEHCAGDHCRFCPHAGVCPSLAATCLAALNENGGHAAVPSLGPYQVAAILAQEATITSWLKAVRERALASLLEGGEVPGYKVVAGREGNRKWTDELQVAEVLAQAGYSPDVYTEARLLSPAALGKKISNKKVFELLIDHIERAPGAPTIAPETDKRPAYDRLAEAKNDFE